jgi:selenocysteine lyase/cysteine desulfurase
MATRGSEDFSRLVDYDFTYYDDARRFEVVTLPYQDFAGFNASLELLLELGPEAVESHVTGLVELIVEWAGSRRDVRLVTPADAVRRAGIVAMVPRGDVRAVSERLKGANVAHSLREGAIRFAPHCYNTEEEVRTALAVMVGERVQI